MSEHFKLQRVNEITGTFVLVVVAVLIAAVVWTGHSQRWFKSRVPLRIVLPEAGAAGIREGSEVYFLGTLVGSVSEVEVDGKGRMEAEAKIRRDFFRFVRADSSAVIKKKFGVAGDSFFEITRGQGRQLPEENASIACAEHFQSALEAAVEEVRRETMLVLKKVNGGLETWTRLGANLGDTRRHLDRLAVRLETMAAGVEAGQGTFGQWLTNPALADDAQKLLARANAAMTDWHGVVTNLQVAVTHVRTGTARLPEITDAVADEAIELPGLVLQMQTSLRELERWVEAMQRHWLLRKYVNPAHPPFRRQGAEIDEPARKSFKPLGSPKGPR